MLKNEITDDILDRMCEAFYDEWNDELVFREWGQYGYTQKQRNEYRNKMKKVYSAIFEE